MRMNRAVMLGLALVCLSIILIVSSQEAGTATAASNMSPGSDAEWRQGLFGQRLLLREERPHGFGEGGMCNLVLCHRRKFAFFYVRLSAAAGRPDRLVLGAELRGSRQTICPLGSD